MKTIVCLLLVLSIALAKPSVDCESKPFSEYVCSAEDSSPPPFGLIVPPLHSYPYCNPDLDIDTRVDDLVSRMTLEEAIGQTSSIAPAIDHLGMRYVSPNGLRALLVTTTGVPTVCMDGPPPVASGTTSSGTPSPPQLALALPSICLLYFPPLRNHLPIDQEGRYCHRR